MATLQLCDLCNGKVKKDFIHVTIRGRLQLYQGEAPPLPKGFEYREGDNIGKRFTKIWDAFGKYQGMIEFVEKPPKYKNMQVVYDLCETCGLKLSNMLEAMRQKYHIENKQVELIGGNAGTWPGMLTWMGGQEVDDDDDDDDEED